MTRRISRRFSGGDPIRAYGLYAFEEGFKLAAQLMAVCLDPRKLDEIP